jgi:hypothetical protein
MARTRTDLARALAVMTWAGLLAAPAWGQTALDRPLDRNLQQGSGGMNPAGRNIGEELRFRNAVVTGNAPGGFSFRGNAGYAAPGEFFGRLGANDTFAFRRDAYASGLGGLGIRGTDALQYQFAMTTGNTPPPSFGGAPVLRRSGSGVSSGMFEPGAAQEAGGGLTPGAGSERRGDGFDGGLARYSVRSPSSYIANRVFQPTMLGELRDQQGNTLGVTASPLRGVNTAAIRPPVEENPANNPMRVPNLNPTQNPESRPQEAPAPRSPLAVPGGPEKTAAPTTRRPTRMDLATAGAASSYQGILDRMAEQLPRSTAELQGPGDGAEPAGALPATDLSTRLRELREQLSARYEPAGSPTAARQPGARGQAEAPTARAPGDGPARPVTPGAEATPRTGERTARERDGDRERRVFDRETVDMLKRAGQVGTLAPPGFDAYSQNMRQGQELLAAGRYFDAEERFTTALGNKAGDPMAAAGRVHAELGSAMFLSASLNLRAMLMQNPELTGAKYAPELLPDRERLGVVAARLRDLIGNKSGRPRDMGMLLAYIGYQTGDAKAVAEGLDAMTEAGADEETVRLAQLMREVWMNPPKERPEAPGPN